MLQNYVYFRLYYILYFLVETSLFFTDEVLSMVYQEFLELFDTDVFHMGGDEVNMNCYNTSKEIRDYLENDNKIGTEEDILDLWRTFQTKVCHILKSHSSGKLEVRGQKAI